MTAPLADTHVHLLAGLDDGPPTPDVAVAMCRMLGAEGAGHATALAHQNESYPENTAARLREAAADLARTLAEKKLPLAVYPTGEVMITPDVADDWRAGRLLSVGDHKKFLLVEMPHGAFVDVLPLARELRADGLRLLIAHAERYPDLLFDEALTAKWIEAGCLIQVTTRAIADPWDVDVGRAVKAWVRRGFVHCLGSDGHGIERRQPRLAEAYRLLKSWVGRPAADRIAGLWGVALLQGLPVNAPPPQPPSRSWFTRLFGG